MQKPQIDSYPSFPPRYEVVGIVGEGAAAQIHRVVDRRDAAVRAIKALRPESNADHAVVARFEDEYRILRGLHHPSLPEVHDYGFTEDGQRYIVMDFVEGNRLDDYFSAHREDLWLLLYELCEVLSFIHDRDLLHLDLKPANILVTRTSAYGDDKPMVKLMDFGLSYRRHAGEELSLVGTPEYMAPEIIRGEGRLTRAADYYSLGITIYQLLTGETPFRGEIRDVFSGHLKREVQFREERTEYAELYPHVYGLLDKDINRRLEAFGGFREAVVAHSVGGIDELDRAYGLGVISSIGRIGKEAVWKNIVEWLDRIGSEAPQAARALTLSGPAGSGKTYLLDDLIERIRLRGANVWRLRPDSLEIDQYLTEWNRIVADARSDPVLVVVDGLDELDDDRRAFVEYLGSRLSLAQSEHDVPALYLVISGRRPDLSRRVKDAFGTGIELKPLTIIAPDPTAISETAAHFRGGSLSSEIRRDLEDFLSRFSGGAGAVITALKTALINGDLEYREGWWQFRAPGHAYSAQREILLGDYYRDLLSDLPRNAHNLLGCLSCHDGAVPIDILSVVFRFEPEIIGEIVRLLAPYRVVEEIFENGRRFVRIAGADAQTALYGELGEEARAGIHSAYVDAYRDALDASASSPDGDPLPSLIQLAHQYEGLRDYRDMFVSFIHAAKKLKKERRHHDLRRLSRSGFSAIARIKGKGWRSRKIAMRRYFLRTFVESCWVTSDYASIKRFVDRYSAPMQGDIPTGLILKYNQTLIYLGDFDRALAVAERIKKNARDSRSIRYLLAELTRGITVNYQGYYDESLSILKQVEEHADILDEYALFRLRFCYYSIYAKIGDEGKTAQNTRRAMKIAKKHNFINEYLAATVGSISNLLSKSMYKECMREIRRAITIASRNKVTHRVGEMYFWASAVYYEQGKYESAARYIRKALQQAVNIGATRDRSNLMIRLAMVYQNMGLYGNSIMYARTASQLRDRSMEALNEALIVLFNFDVHMVANSKHTDLWRKRSDRFMARFTGGQKVGYYHYLLGMHHSRRNDIHNALVAFSESRSNYHKSHIKDDEMRAGIKEALVLLAIGRHGRAKQLIERLGRIRRDFESKNIEAEYQALQLAYLYRTRTSAASIRRQITKCEAAMGEAKEVPVLLTADKIVFRAMARIGDRPGARRVFNNHVRRIKRIAANMPDQDYASDFLNEPDERLLMQEYKLVTRD